MTPYRAVWISYASRPLMWLLAASLFAMSLSLPFLLRRPYATLQPIELQSRRRVDSVAMLKAAAKRPEADYWLDYGRIARDPDEHQKFAALLERQAAGEEGRTPPNIVAAFTGVYRVDRAALEELAQLPSIEAIQIPIGDDANGALDLRPLAKLPKLQTLELVAVERLLEPQSIEDLTHLKSLRLSAGLVDAETLRAVAASGVRELFLPNVTRDSEAMRALEGLAHADQLEAVYVDAPGDDPLFTALRQATPGVPLKSSLYRPSTAYGMLVTLHCVLIFALAGSHIYGQAGLSLAELAPRFRAPHRRAAWIVAGAVWLVPAVAATFAGVHWALAFSVLAAAATWTLQGGYDVQVRTQPPSLGNRVLGGSIVMAWIAAAVGLLNDHVAAESLLTRPPFWLPCIAAVVALV
ncbi:MAG: hypothetical protein KDA61_11445, partial [Planctomycetales bacterium]|nr:hypothetical protein [Planctomycetales bacterium]